VAGHIFQARPVWIYTQSNITNIIFTWVPNNNTEKIQKILFIVAARSIKRPLNHTKIQRVQSPWLYNINSDKNIRLLLRPRSRAPLTLLQRRDPGMMSHVSDDSRRSVGVLPLYYSVKMSVNMSRNREVKIPRFRFTGTSIAILSTNFCCILSTNMACNFHIALNFVSSWAYRWSLSRGRFEKYDKYRVFPTSIFMWFRSRKRKENIDYSPKIYIIERLRKIDRGR
jgi:hypothetical protein